MPLLYEYDVEWTNDDNTHRGVLDSMHDFHDVFAEINEGKHDNRHTGHNSYGRDEGREQLVALTR